MRDDIEDATDRAIALAVQAEYENRYRETFRLAMRVGGVTKNQEQVMLAMSRTVARVMQRTGGRVDPYHLEMSRTVAGVMQRTGGHVDPYHLAFMASFLMEELDA